jgi:hypothetical protein
VLAVVRVSGTSLDVVYLQNWASFLNVKDLLDRALNA